MSCEELVAGSSNEFHTAEETTTGIPTGAERVACVGTHGDDVVLTKAQSARDFNLEAHVAIVGAANALTIEVDIANIHDASEVEQQALVLQTGIGRQVIAIPPLPHLLEAAAREATPDVRSNIGIVGFLTSIGCHPRLFNLEIVRKGDGAPATIVVGWLCCLRDVAGMEPPAID